MPTEAQLQFILTEDATLEIMRSPLFHVMFQKGGLWEIMLS